MKKLTIVLSLVLSVFAGNALAAKSSPLLDETHANAGIKCASCHGKTETREAVTMMKCVQCHNTKKLAEKTKNVQPTNPHKNHHFDTELDCASCHNVHEKSENYCGSCHLRFDFIVP